MSIATQHLVIPILRYSDSHDALPPILRNCQNLKSLFIEGYATDREHFLRLLTICCEHIRTLRRLSLLGLEPFEIPETQGIQHLFRFVTHLEIDKLDAGPPGIQLHLPSLTHLILYVRRENHGALGILDGIREDLRIFPQSNIRYFLPVFHLENEESEITYSSFFPGRSGQSILELASPHVVIGFLQPLEDSDIATRAPATLLFDQVLQRYRDRADNPYLTGRDLYEIVEEMVASRLQK